MILFTISLIRPWLCFDKINENYEHTPSLYLLALIHCVFSTRKPEFRNYSSNLLVKTSFLPACLVTAYVVGVNFIHKFNLLKGFSIAIVVFTAESLNVYFFSFKLLPRKTAWRHFGLVFYSTENNIFFLVAAKFDIK